MVELKDDNSLENSMFGGLNFDQLDLAAITSSSDEASHQSDENAYLHYDPTLIVDQLLQHQDRLPCASEEDFSELFAWVKRHGANLEGVRFDRDQHGGRSLFASRSCCSGGVLATLPRSLRLGQAYACDKLGLPRDTPELSALTLLVLAFCQEGHVYARCLPRNSEFTNALLMTQQEQKEVEEKMGSNYAEACRALRGRGDACASYIQQYLASTQNDYAVNNHRTLYWAISMVKSRSHAFGSKRGFWLTPILDLANHSTNPNAKLEGDSTGFLVLKALREIKQDEEISIDYQVEDDAHLFATYGFSLEAGVSE